MQTPTRLPHQRQIPSVFFGFGLASLIDMSGIKTFDSWQRALPLPKKAASPFAAATSQVNDAARGVTELFNTMKPV